MEHLSLIKHPIESELEDFNRLFTSALTHPDGMLSQALAHIRQRTGKRMRPMLILLMAKCFGRISGVTLNAAAGLELLHTASLVHDDVVDESSERRGQPSVNALYDNKVAILVGDYLLSTALLHVSLTDNHDIVRYLARLGQTLASGEILQLTNISSEAISEEVYYRVIEQKTAALFEACCAIGALSAGSDAATVERAREFGQNLGTIFQIRDDIFDYYDSREIGKPTGNDMAEGKLTLPVIYALREHGTERLTAIARKVKERTVEQAEIAELVEFTKANGGIEYAERQMELLRAKCSAFIADTVADADIKAALEAYVDFVIQRSN